MVVSSPATSDASSGAITLEGNSQPRPIVSVIENSFITIHKLNGKNYFE